MKKCTLWARRALFLGLVSLVGCGSDGTGPESLPDFTAYIDGEPFQATTASAERVGGGVAIEADDDSFRGMGFEFEGLTPDTYTPYRAEVNLGLSVWLSFEDVGSRSVTVTTFTSERIAGTFELTLVDGSGTDTVRVTDGRFDLAF
jgi:hypothetical protein